MKVWNLRIRWSSTFILVYFVQGISKIACFPPFHPHFFSHTISGMASGSTHPKGFRHDLLPLSAFPEKTEIILINDPPGQHHHHLHHHIHNHGHRPNSLSDNRQNHKHIHKHAKKSHTYPYSHKPWQAPRHGPTVIYHHPHSHTHDHSNEHEHSHVQYDYSPHSGVSDWEHHATNIHNFRVDKNGVFKKEGNTNLQHLAVFNRGPDYNTLTTTSPDYESYALRSRGLSNSNRNRNKELYFHDSFKARMIRPTPANTVTWTPKNFPLVPGNTLNFTVGSLLF